MSPVAEKLERLIFDHKVLGSDLSQPDEQSNRKTNHGIGFYGVYLESLPRLTIKSLHMFI